jgi:outer membrane protein assembly factor BamB
MRNYTQGATVADGVLYVGTFNSAPYRIYALDAATGGNLWSREMPAFVGTSPAIRSHTLYITTGNEIRALNASTGETRWSFTAGDIINLSAPAVANGIVCVGSFDDSIYALNASTGQLLWSYQTGGHVGYSPAVVDGTLYVGSFDHTLYAFGLPEQRYSRSPGGWLGDVELRRLHGTLIE